MGRSPIIWPPLCSKSLGKGALMQGRSPCIRVKLTTINPAAFENEFQNSFEKTKQNGGILPINTKELLVNSLVQGPLAPGQ